ncbi:hypothetical protein LCGC14_2552270 [marine sediment metagenome]|uniref:Uncharacterized protein n=1 Tax=marine sediment metagenome TaxID=412755 RepID=A0A0F9AN55_9ZZZZ
MPVFLLYIDPTAAGLGLQMLLAGAVGSLVTIRLFWGRVFSMFSRTEQEAEEVPASCDRGFRHLASKA